MTGYKSKKAAAQGKLEDDDTQVYQTELTKLLMESYDKGVADALAETKAAQRPWVGLTAEEILDLFDATNVYGSKWIEFAREIEQLLKEKNT